MQASSIIILLLIPAFIALGHDAYLFYENFLNPGVFSLDLLMEEFKLSAVGFLWTTYGLESYKSAVRGLEPDSWAMVDAFLTYKAFYVCLAFAAIVTAILVFFSLFNVGPFSGIEGRSKSSKNEPSFRGKNRIRKQK